MKEITLKLSLVILGAVLAQPLGVILLDSAYAMSEAEITEEFTKIESQLQEFDDSFDIDTIGSKSFELKQISQNLLEIKKIDSNYELKQKLDLINSEFESKLSSFKKQAEDFEKANKDLVTQKRQMILEVKKLQSEYETKTNSIKQKQETVSLIKDSVQKIENEKKFQNIMTKIGVEQASKSKYAPIPDKIANLALEQVANNKEWNLLPTALDRMIQKYPQPQIQEKLIEAKTKVITTLNSMNTLETSVQTLKATDVDVPDFDKINGIFEITTIATIEADIASALDVVSSEVAKYDSVVEETRNSIIPINTESKNSLIETTKEVIEDDSTSDDSTSDDSTSDDSTSDDSTSDDSGSNAKTNPASENVQNAADKVKENTQHKANKAAENVQNAADKIKDKSKD